MFVTGAAVESRSCFQPPPPQHSQEVATQKILGSWRQNTEGATEACREESLAAGPRQGREWLAARLRLRCSFRKTPVSRRTAVSVPAPCTCPRKGGTEEFVSLACTTAPPRTPTLCILPNIPSLRSFPKTCGSSFIVLPIFIFSSLLCSTSSQKWKRSGKRLDTFPSSLYWQL